MPWKRRAEKQHIRWSWAAVYLLGIPLLWSCQGTPSEAPDHQKPSAAEEVVDLGTEGPLSTTDVRGVVIEDVGQRSALEKAGLQPGDVVLTWKRLPNPPANPDGAEGQLASVFDWLWVEVEQAPRGPLQLFVGREGEPLILTVEAGPWDTKAHPSMMPALLEPYLEGKKLIDGGDHASGIAKWQDLADGANEPVEESLRCWFQLRIGEVWTEEKAWEKAQAAYQSALEVAREPVAKIAVWDASGKSFERQNAFDEAEASYRSLVELRQATWGESLGFAVGLNNLGNMAWKRGDPEQASELFQRTLAIQKRLAPGSLHLAGSLNNLGNVASMCGDLKQAVKYLQPSLKILENLAPGSLYVATSLNNLGTVAWRSGDLEQAAESFQRSLEIQENLAPESLDVARSLNNLGLVAWNRGDLAQATGLFQQSLEIAEKLTPGSLDAARCLNNLGNVADQRGNLEKATEYHLRSLKIVEKLAPGSLQVAGSLGNLGTVASNRGDLERAVEYHRQALEIREHLAPGSLQVAVTLSNLGNVALERGYLERASGYHQQALKIKEDLAPGSLDVAKSLKNLGDVASDHGNLKRAAECWQQALEIQENLAPESLEVALTLNKLGNVALDHGDLERAAEYYLRALNIRETLAPGSLDMADSLKSLGLVARHRGELERATHFFRRSLAALEEQIGKLGGSHDLQGRFLAEHESIYRNALELYLDFDEPEEAFAILERSRARIFLAMLTERDLDFSADTSERLDQSRRRFTVLFDKTLHEMTSLRPDHDQDKIKSLKRKLQDLRWKYEENMQTIRRESPKLAALQDPRPLDLQGAREALDPGTVLLSYSAGEKHSDLFVVTRDGGLETHRIPSSQDALQRDIERLRHLLEDANLPTDDQQIQLSRQLYHTLLAPTQQTIERSERILIAADGPLHFLPFGALLRERDDGRQQYLAAWKPLHSVLSATVYAELKKSRPAPTNETDSSPQLVAFGDPVYDRDIPEAGEQVADIRLRSITEQDYFDWDPLPSTRREVEEIARLFPPQAARGYLGADATEDRAKALGKTRILHYAVHAFTNARSPLDSGLVFTLPEQFSEDRDNGVLQVWEIFEHLRIDADLVVLSACETGLGKLRGGEGLIGLTRAFQYAGARSVLATLWSIGDESTAELMIRFYRHLQAGKSKDEALRAAQLEFIRGPIQVRDQQGMIVERDFSDPYFWAAFQLIGDWR